jgi:glycosyltransferase involved in cell wall biosynthesis
MNNETQLAIVIPYFKISYFEILLDSLSNQTHKKFNVYIGNDGSPDSPKNLINEYKDKLNINYHKFPNNLGKTDLVGQWHRCLTLLGDEKWVWLLPDDDKPSLNVVEEFYKNLVLNEKHNIKVFRMGLSVIDGDDKIIDALDQINPLLETNLDFYTRVLKGKTSSTLGDNIFNRESLMKHGGFISLPKAWGSDHATVLSASQGGNIFFLSNCRLYFRMSGENISSNKADSLIKLDARIQFVKWLKSHESIFPSIPNKEFYKYYYWKSEYYVLDVWNFHWILFFKLNEIKQICFQSSSYINIIKIFLIKIFR